MKKAVNDRGAGCQCQKLNPGLPQAAYQEALRQIIEYSRTQPLLQINREKHDLLRDGVQVQFCNDDGVLETRRLRVFDFDSLENNHFLAVRELWIKGDLFRRRPDLIGFVNGRPLVFGECKNIHRDLRRTFGRNLAEGLHEESPALFDLMKKEQLDNKTIAQIKGVAKELLARLRSDYSATMTVARCHPHTDSRFSL